MRASANAAVDDQIAELLQFLYACPVGLVQLSTDGTIGMVNPLAMQLLLPIATDGQVTNFFSIIGKYAPELRHIIAAFNALTARSAKAIASSSTPAARMVLPIRSCLHARW